MDKEENEMSAALLEYLFIEQVSRRSVFYRVFEVDEKTYLVHTRDKRDYYNNFFEYEFYISNLTGKWVCA